MSSGFVSAGSTEETKKTNDDWEKAKQDIEEARRKRQEGLQDGGQSLYEILQQNKAAKQEAFEESIRLKNQFRSLDEDEVEFLDSVLESTRAQEDAVRKETTERLDAFRKQQEEADQIRLREEHNDQPEATGSVEPVEEQWAATGRKRKKLREKEALRGVKLRKSSSTKDKPDLTDKVVVSTESTQADSQSSPPKDIRQSQAERSKADSAGAKRASSPESKPSPETNTLPSKSAVPASEPARPATGLLGLAYDSDEDP